MCLEVLELAQSWLEHSVCIPGFKVCCNLELPCSWTTFIQVAVSFLCQSFPKTLKSNCVQTRLDIRLLSCRVSEFSWLYHNNWFGWGFPFPFPLISHLMQTSLLVACSHQGGISGCCFHTNGCLICLQEGECLLFQKLFLYVLTCQPTHKLVPECFLQICTKFTGFC